MLLVSQAEKVETLEARIEKHEGQLAILTTESQRIISKLARYDLWSVELLRLEYWYVIKNMVFMDNILIVLRINLWTLLVMRSVFCFTQAQNNFWYFGHYAGLDFSSGTGIPIHDGMLYAHEGTAGISDTLGNLLFYTDGSNVWDSSHAIMLNGTGLHGCELIPSSSQSSLVYPMPLSCTKYYVFTADCEENEGVDHVGLQYSIVDMNGNGGLGEVTIKNQPLIVNTGEKIAVVPHENGVDFWVITHGRWDNFFHAFLISSDSVHTTPVSTGIGMTHWFVNNGGGRMAVTIDGTKLACVSANLDSLQVVDFDASTGIVTNSFTLEGGGYGVEFSPDGTKLYVSRWGGGWVRQFDLSAGSPALIQATEVNLALIPSTNGGALQLAPDGKIYMARGETEYVATIEFPNLLGLDCNFLDNAIWLDAECWFGLPTFAKVYPNSCSLQTNGTATHGSSGSKISVYPNPSDGQEIKIIYPSGFDRYILSTLTGITKESGKLEALLTFSNLTSGVYCLTIFGNADFSTLLIKVK